MAAKEVQAVQTIPYLNSNTKGTKLLHFHGSNGYVNVPQCYVL